MAACRDHLGGLFQSTLSIGAISPHDNILMAVDFTIHARTRVATRNSGLSDRISVLQSAPHGAITSTVCAEIGCFNPRAIRDAKILKNCIGDITDIQVITLGGVRRCAQGQQEES